MKIIKPLFSLLVFLKEDREVYFMDSKLVVDKIDMLVSDVNPLFITVLIFLLLVAFKILSILYVKFLVTDAFKFINIAVWHPIYYGKQLSGFNKFLWFVMTPILYVIFAFFLVLLFRYLFG